MSLHDRVMLIIGNMNATGQAIARACLAAGASVAVVGERVADIDALWLDADVGDAQQIASAIARTQSHYGRLDGVINCPATLGAVGSLMTLSCAHWRTTHAAVLDRALVITREAAHALRERGGVLLNLVSIAGVMGGQAPHALTTAEHAVIGLTRSAASELSQYGIRVNAVARAVPGGLRSPLTPALNDTGVAAALVYLASDAAAHVTAHTLVVDGGVTAGGFASGASVLRDRPMGFIGPSGQEVADGA